MRCPSCGEENPERARFCLNCASPLAADASRPRETRKTVTVLFSDLAGSTALGERLDPESVRVLMKRYFAEMRRIIERHGGTVEKFIGDAVMAVFGVPQVHEDDALRAVRAALEIRDALARLDEHVDAEGGQRVSFRTGINTGEVIAGDSATGETLATGDAVNTAARLEQAAAPGDILLGRSTYQLVRDAVVVEATEPIAAKGKEMPVSAYRLVSLAVTAQGPVRSLDAPLVGRERELSVLEEAFSRATKERAPQIVTVLGTAGVGKSRLVAEFMASADDARTLRGRCLPYGDGITYWPIREIVHGVAGIADADDPERAFLRLHAVMEGDPDADLIARRVASAIGLETDSAPQEEIFWATRKLLEHCARSERLVLLIEDIHWAEATLLDLLDYIISLAADAPMLLICPARPELLESRPGWGAGRANAQTMFLEPLAPAASSELLGRLPGGSALPPRLRGRILDAAEGNPLYVEEMLRMLVDEGHLIRTNSHWIATGELADIAVPPSVQALLAARIDSLPAAERDVAARASVVGRVFEEAAVRALAHKSQRDDVGVSLLGLVHKELVRPERPEITAGDAFKFRHLLIRDAAYHALPKAERADLHERFADWLELAAAERITEYEEIVGYHLEQALRYRQELGAVDRTGAIAVRAAARIAGAAARARARGDVPAAASMYSRAVDLVPHEDATRTELLTNLGAVLTETGDWARAEAVLSEATDRARAAGDRRAEALASVRSSYLGGHMGRFATNLELFPAVDAAIATFEELHDDAGLAEARTLRGLLYFWRGMAARAVESFEAASAAARDAGDPRAEADAARWRSNAETHGPTPVGQAIGHFEEIIDAAAAPDRVMRMWVARLLAEMTAMRGEFERSTSLAAEAEGLAKELGLEIFYASGVLRAAAVLATLQGRHDDAERHLAHGAEILRRAGDLGHLSSVLGLLADSVARQGRYDEALAIVEEAQEATLAGDVDAEVNWMRARAKALAHLGRIDEAVPVADAAAERARATDYLDLLGSTALDRAEVLELAGRRADAVGALREALDAFDRKGHRVGAAAARARLESFGASSSS
ncbi:MAG: adenylate/guanylate cyclase domain-containing protein [Candidatus Limnocylindria bacterium]